VTSSSRFALVIFGDFELRCRVIGFSVARAQVEGGSVRKRALLCNPDHRTGQSQKRGGASKQLPSLLNRLELALSVQLP